MAGIGRKSRRRGRAESSDPVAVQVRELLSAAGDTANPTTVSALTALIKESGATAQTAVRAALRPHPLSDPRSNLDEEQRAAGVEIAEIYHSITAPMSARCARYGLQLPGSTAPAWESESEWLVRARSTYTAWCRRIAAAGISPSLVLAFAFEGFSAASLDTTRRCRKGRSAREIGEALDEWADMRGIQQRPTGARSEYRFLGEINCAAAITSRAHS